MKKIWGLLILTPMLFIGTSCGSHSAGVEDEIDEPFGESGKSSGMASIEFAKSLSIGWNLGNTLDANSKDTKKNLGLSTETCWGMPETTEAMIKAVAKKGFKTIRIPVSWHNHITSDDGNYTIDSEWLARVKTVVDWARGAGMYVILNVHHDDLTRSEMNSMYGYCVDLDSELQRKSKAYLRAVWRQIATKFAAYDEHLIFEVLNEPRYRDGENNGFTAPSNLSDYNKVIKDYEETCISAIRSVSGNANRYIMVPFYAASPYSSEGWSVPSDSASGKLLISTHAYSPYEFAMNSGSVISHTEFTTTGDWNDKKELEQLFSKTATNAPLKKWLNNGYGVVMGEASATDKQNDPERKKWIQSYFGYAKAAGVPVVLWDNMVVYPDGNNASERHGWFNRKTCSWFKEDLINEMMEYKN